MPSLPDRIPPSGPNDPAAPIPTIDPESFEDFEGFRETTLAVFTDPAANATLRGLGDLLYALALEYCRHWPVEPEGSFYHQARAAVADLRHLQGYLAHLDRQREEASLSDHEERISEICGSLVPDLRAVADALEVALGPMGAARP
jgi:hypothetical protein